MIDEERIRKFVHEKLEQRTGLIVHTAVFLTVNFVINFINITENGWGDYIDSFPGPLFITFFWGIGLVAHFMDYYHKYGGGRERREATIQREIERERLRQYGAKAKNDDLYGISVRLTEDGELTDSTIEELSTSTKRSRS